MSQPYQIVVGLEVHVQLLTESKLFCGCRTRFGLPPNSATCPVCLGLPGALPVMNVRAFELAVKAALALNCNISPFTKWDRKNYFYPDLPKNYQISQYDLPFSRGGWLDIEADNSRKRIRIIRVHLEEDAGKMLHEDAHQSSPGRVSRIDLNRAGTPLLEIVSEPDINAPQQAKTYLEEIRLLMRDLQVSDCEMQEGSLRCDANINLHIGQGKDTTVATPIVEIKNLNSIRAVERALKYEAGRQFAEFQRTGQKLGEVPKATAGWDENKGITVIQRRKEEASDYRYFPDPDLTPVEVSAETIARLRSETGELPAAVRQRLQTELQLSAYHAGVLTAQGREFVHFYEGTAAAAGDAKDAANWMTNQVLTTLHERKMSIVDFPLSPAQLGDLLRRCRDMGLNKKRSQAVYRQMLESGDSAERAIDKLGIVVVSDEGELREIVRQAIAENAKAVADYRNGKKKALDAVKGAVMRQTKGTAKMELVEKLLAEELGG